MYGFHVHCLLDLLIFPQIGIYAGLSGVQAFASLCFGSSIAVLTYLALRKLHKVLEFLKAHFTICSNKILPESHNQSNSCSNAIFRDKCKPLIYLALASAKSIP